MTLNLLITGASRGLGLCLVERFAASGHAVIAAALDSTERLTQLVERSQGRIVEVPMDVTRAESIARARDSVSARLVELDILINNAAVLPDAARGPLGSLDYTAGAHTMDVNAFGPLRVTEAFLPLLERGTRRLIVNVSSEAGSVADCWRKDEFFYCMSKAALNMQSAILRNLLEPKSIEVLAVHPGWMRTDMGGKDADIDPAEAAEGIVELVAQRRLGQKAIYFDYRGRALRW